MSAPLSDLSAAIAGLVRTAAPSLVTVLSGGSRHSGFFWKPGLVVTAEEVVEEEGEVAIESPEGKRGEAEVVGRDPTTDVALLRVEGLEGSPALLAPAEAEAGALVLAVGAGPTAQLGVVAVAGPAWRSMRGGEIDARIELDLHLRRESEGGLALDAKGRVLGMAVFGPRRRTLVIPSATIARVAEQLEKHGRVPRGWLGLALQPVRGEDGPAVMVMSVERDGPAATAGIAQGDVIVGWDGEPPARLDRLLRALGPASVGRPLRLTLRRGGETREVTLTIGERPER